MHSEKNETVRINQTSSLRQTVEKQPEDEKTLSEPKSEAHRDLLTQSLEDMLDDVRRLARYAVETGQLPTYVNIEELYRIRLHYEQNRKLEEDEFGTVVKAYQHIERLLGPVNNDTLKATEERVENGKIVHSAAWKYVQILWARTYINIAIILASHLIHHYAVQSKKPSVLEFVALAVGYLIPFLYGALGADAYVLRETTHKLHTRQFDPRRIPENRARLLLGTLSGGMVVFFVSSDILLGTPPTGTPPNIVDTIFSSFGGAAAGFIAGYSTDFLFDTIERLIGAILPRVGATTRRDIDTRQYSDEMLRKYRLMMEATEDKRVKEV